jgi:hypothetical protein
MSRNSVAGYNVKEEVKEIGKELKSSRGELIIGVLSFLAGSIIASSLTREKSVIDQIRDRFGYDREDEEEE